MEVGSCRAWHRALAVAPLTRRGLRAIDLGLISVNVEPQHPAFPHWMKCVVANQHFRTEIPLTDVAQLAGFTDSAHLSRSWQRRFGMPPSYLRDERHVQIIA